MREEGIEIWLPARGFENYEVSSKGRVLNCNQSDICKCLNGKAKHCKGYHFELL